MKEKPFHELKPTTPQDHFITRLQNALDRYADGISLEVDQASQENRVGIELCDIIGNDEAKM